MIFLKDSRKVVLSPNFGGVFVPCDYNLTYFCSDMKRTTGNDNLDLLLVSAFKDKRNQSRFDHCTFGSTFAMVHVFGIDGSDALLRQNK